MPAWLIYLPCVSVFLSVPSWPPADRANVLRGLSSPSPHRLEQTGTEKTLLVFLNMLQRVEKGQSKQFSWCFCRCFYSSVSGYIMTAGAAEVLCDFPSNGNVSASQNFQLQSWIQYLDKLHCGLKCAVWLLCVQTSWKLDHNVSLKTLKSDF